LKHFRTGVRLPSSPPKRRPPLVGGLLFGSNRGVETNSEGSADRRWHRQQTAQCAVCAMRGDSPASDIYCVHWVVFTFGGDEGSNSRRPKEVPLGMDYCVRSRRPGQVYGEGIGRRPSLAGGLLFGSNRGSRNEFRRQRRQAMASAANSTVRCLRNERRLPSSPSPARAEGAFLTKPEKHGTEYIQNYPCASIFVQNHKFKIVENICEKNLTQAKSLKNGAKSRKNIGLMFQDTKNVTIKNIDA